MKRRRVTCVSAGAVRARRAAVAAGPAGEVARDRARAVRRLAVVGDDVVAVPWISSTDVRRSDGQRVERAVAAGDRGDRRDVRQLAADPGREAAAVGHAGGEHARRVARTRRSALAGAAPRRSMSAVPILRFRLQKWASRRSGRGPRSRACRPSWRARSTRRSPAGAAGAVEGEHERRAAPCVRRHVQQRAVELLVARRGTAIRGRARGLRRVSRPVDEQEGDARGGDGDERPARGDGCDGTSEANAQARLRANVSSVTGAATATSAATRGTPSPTAPRSSTALLNRPAATTAR